MTQQQLFGILLMVSVMVGATTLALTAYFFLIADNKDAALVAGIIAVASMMDSVVLSWMLRRAEKGGRS
jgi:hypothetical protein